ncbi:MAG: hypothetical protein J2P23_04320 [Microlunatus sp.]|nr:hypothetical protein [Microlunatus sp.]
MSAPGGPYGLNPYGPPPYPMPREHPEGTLILILGVVSLVCSPIGLVAWYLGSKAERGVEESGQYYSNLSSIKAGKIIGMITGILSIIGILAVIAYILFMLVILGVITTAAG